MEVNQTHPGNPINDEKAVVPRSTSRFDLYQRLNQSQIYSYIYPHLCIEGVEADKLSFRSIHNLDTYTLKAPIKSDMTMHKTYIQVFKECLLPFNSEKVTVNPSQGDDVAVDVNTVSEHFYREYLPEIFRFPTKFIIEGSEEFGGGEISDEYALNKVTSHLRGLVVAEMFLSDGSLLNSLGCNLSGMWKYHSLRNGVFSQADTGFDGFFSDYLSTLRAMAPAFYVQLLNPDGTTDGYSRLVVLNRQKFDTSTVNQPYMVMHSFLEFIRENPNFTLIPVDPIDEVSIYDWTQWSNFWSDSVPEITDGISCPFASDIPDEALNFGRCAAYQIAVAHFFTNDSVDFVYSAELYRESVHSVLSGLGILNTFTYNGIEVPYDYLSGYYFDRVMESMSEDVLPAYSALYLAYIFGYRRSLRFVDYFTAAKPRPLAVGNTTVQVNSGAVDVIDVTKKLQMQRFLNAVNRFGRKFSSYTQGLFGVTPQQDFHNPAFLADTADTINPSDLQNTGADQLSSPSSVTSTLHSRSNDFEFTVFCDRQSYIIGLTHFDIKRTYAWSTDRAFFHKDRFDDFNPFLQFVGDQEIKGLEVSSRRFRQRFGYSPRYMEYKQLVSRSVGAFVRNLPGWAFVADNATGLIHEEEISPDYVRNSCVELDDFYVSLTGNTLGNYFHFITTYDNIITAYRRMQYQSQIL